MAFTTGTNFTVPSQHTAGNDFSLSGVAVALTGASTTTTYGSVVPGAGVTLGGLSSSVAAGTFPEVLSGIWLPITGISATATAGTATPGTTVTPAGVSTNIQYGTVSVASDSTAALTGASASTSAAPLGVESSLRVSGFPTALTFGTVKSLKAMPLAGRTVQNYPGSLAGRSTIAVTGYSATVIKNTVWPALGLKSISGITSAKGSLSKSGTLVLGGSKVVAEVGNAYPSMVFSQTGQSVATAAGGLSSARQKALIGNMAAVSENALNFASSDKQVAITGNLITFSAGAIYIGPDPWYNFTRVVAVSEGVTVILKDDHADITVIQLA